MNQFNLNFPTYLFESNKVRLQHKKQAKIMDLNLNCDKQKAAIKPNWKKKEQYFVLQTNEQI